MKKLYFFILWMLTTQAYGGGFTGEIGISKINQRECEGDKGFQITLASAHVNPDTCDNDKTIDISCDHAGFNQLVSVALTAFTTKKKINAFVKDCDSEGQARVTAISISD